MKETKFHVIVITITSHCPVRLRESTLSSQQRDIRTGLSY